MVRVLCFGNPWHGDDGFAVHVYRLLMARPRPAHVGCHEVGTQGPAALHLLEDCHKAILVDALAGEAPGALLRFEVEAGAPAAPSLSLHAMGVEHLISCVPILFADRPLPQLVVVGAGIGAAPTLFHDQLSPEVAGALDGAVACIEAEWA